MTTKNCSGCSLCDGPYLRGSWAASQARINCHKSPVDPLPTFRSENLWAFPRPNWMRRVAVTVCMFVYVARLITGRRMR